jgi:serine/threonine protein phosphatase 1
MPEGVSDFQKAIMQTEELLTPEHIHWIANLPYLYETPDYVFVHAGLPNEPLETIRKKIDLGDNKLQQQLIWIRSEFIYSPFNWNKTVIYAHTGTAEPNVGINRIGINTFPRHNGFLTAIEIPSMKFFRQWKL